MAFIKGKLGEIFCRPKVALGVLGPGADGIAQVEKLVAVDFRARPAGFAGQDIGELVAFIEQVDPAAGRAVGRAQGN